MFCPHCGGRRQEYSFQIEETLSEKIKNGQFKTFRKREEIPHKSPHRQIKSSLKTNRQEKKTFKSE